MAELDLVLRATVTICILVFSAKVLGELFTKIKIPSVLGELVAGIILGPYALGSIISISGTPLIEINEIVQAFGEIGGILILFVAGLEMTFTDFRHVGASGFTIGTLGVVVPFAMGYGFSTLLGLGTGACLVIAASLVATSISITSLVLQELKKSRTIECKTMVSAAVVDDVLGLAIPWCHRVVHFKPNNNHRTTKRISRNPNFYSSVAYSSRFSISYSSQIN